MELAREGPGRQSWVEAQTLAMAAALAGHVILEKEANLIAAASFALALALGLLRRSRAKRFHDASRASAERRLAWLMIATAWLIPLGSARTPSALRWLGVVAPLARQQAGEVGAAAVASGALLVVLPLVLGEAALRAGSPDGPVDARRLRVAMRAGATIAVAMIVAAMTTMGVAALNLRIDTAVEAVRGPGAATRGVLVKLATPARATLAFPRDSEIGQDVADYFSELAGAQLQVARIDRAVDRTAARDLGVEDDGVIILATGPKIERIAIGLDRRAARARLRRLDGDVERALRRLSEPERVVYLTSGHGEAGEPGAPGDRRIDRLRALLEAQNVVTKELGLGRGLARDVPSDATMVLCLGPRGAFSAEEIEALERYVAGDGRLLLALERGGSANVALAALVGVSVRDVSIALERPVARRNNDRSDAGIVVITGDRSRGGSFASHPSVATLARQAGRAALYVPGASPLTFGTTPQTDLSFVIDTGEASFLDGNDDFAKSDDEAGGPFSIGVAVESATDAPRKMRAFVLGDVDAWTDDALGSSGSNATFAIDVLRWLRGEEPSAFADAPLEPERPVHIRRTKAAWFWFAILGMPATVAMVGVFIRRRLARV